MPNYQFTRDIPVTNNDPSIDQPVITENTNSTDSILKVDLFGFNDNNGGTHQKSTYVVQVSDPVPVNTNGAQGIVYSKTVNSIAEIFVNRFGSATPVQLTSGAVSISSTGYTFLPGGVIFQWGAINFASGSSNVTFPIAFPNAFFGAQITGSNSTTPSSNGIMTYSASSQAGFTAYQNGSSATTGFYIAIGN